ADANPEDAQTYLRMSEIYRRQGKYDQALDDLKKAEAMVPDALEVPYNIAVVYEAQARYDEAIKILQDLLKKTEKADGSYSQGDRNNRGIFIERLGMVYRDQENYPAAIETFRKMLTVGGDDNVKTGYQDISILIARPSSGRRLPLPPKRQCRKCLTTTIFAWCSTPNSLTPAIRRSLSPTCARC